MFNWGGKDTQNVISMKILKRTPMQELLFTEQPCKLDYT